MTVGDFCNRQVVFARREESVTEAARRMRDFHVGTLVVVDEHDGRRFPGGLLTDRDLVVRILAQGGRAAGATVVREAMTSNLVTAQETDDLVDALKKMSPAVTGRQRERWPGGRSRIRRSRGFGG